MNRFYAAILQKNQVPPSKTRVFFCFVLTGSRGRLNQADELLSLLSYFLQAPCWVQRLSGTLMTQLVKATNKA